MHRRRGINNRILASITAPNTESDKSDIYESIKKSSHFQPHLPWL